MLSCCNGSGVLNGVDMLSERYSMKLDGDRRKVSTFCGACCSLVLLILIALFAIEKFIVLLHKKDVTVINSESSLYFADSDPFDYEHGLNVAVAFTGYDGETQWQLDPSYGELVLNANEWGINEDGSYYRNVLPLTRRKCTLQELGLRREEGSKFYPTSESSVKILELYKNKLLCFNEEDLLIAGSFGTGRARQLNIQLRKCLGENCKNDVEINEFFKQKYLVLFSNQARFVPDGFDNQKVVNESLVTWLPIST